jgi:hypothetical protein
MTYFRYVPLTSLFLREGRVTHSLMNLCLLGFKCAAKWVKDKHRESGVNQSVLLRLYGERNLWANFR